MYYKTELAARLDEVAVSLCSRAQKYGDIHASITDLQNNVLQQVAQRVASLRAVLFDVSSVLAEIDVLLGWSEVCSECGYVRPSILHDFSIHIIVGFAPLSRAERTPSPPGARRRPLHPQRFPRFHFLGSEDAAGAGFALAGDSDGSEQQREVGVSQAAGAAGLPGADRLLRSGRARVSVFVPLHPHQIQHDRKVGRSLASLLASPTSTPPSLRTSHASAGSSKRSPSALSCSSTSSERALRPKVASQPSVH